MIDQPTLTTQSIKKRKPMGYTVVALHASPDDCIRGAASGTVWDAAVSLRQAMAWGQGHMARSPNNFFTLTPIFGPVA